jgi:hypothetical protein
MRLPDPLSSDIGDTVQSWTLDLETLGSIGGVEISMNVTSTEINYVWQITILFEGDRTPKNYGDLPKITLHSHSFTEGDFTNSVEKQQIGQSRHDEVYEVQSVTKEKMFLC